MVVLSSARCFIDLCCASQPSQQGRINWTVFLLLWLTSAYCEQCFQTPNDSLSGGKKWFYPPASLLFCLLALAFPFEMTKFFGCALPLSWQVTSVKRNNLQYALTSLSTTNKERKRQMALLSLIAGTNKTARPSPGIKSCLAGNPLCLRRKNQVVSRRRALQRRTSALRFWGCVRAGCVELLRSEFSPTLPMIFIAPHKGRLSRFTSILLGF